jgi:hypothetical protein
LVFDPHVTPVDASVSVSDDLFLGSDGTASADAVAGARGLLLPQQTVDTTGTVAHAAAKLPPTLPSTSRQIKKSRVVIPILTFPSTI